MSFLSLAMFTSIGSNFFTSGFWGIPQFSRQLVFFLILGQESGSFVAVATAILSIVSVFLGAKYRKLLSRGRLFAELLNDIIVAAEDDKVSEEEFQNVVAASKLVAADVEGA